MTGVQARRRPRIHVVPGEQHSQPWRPWLRSPGASGHEKMRVCGQLAPGWWPLFLQSCGQLSRRWLCLFSAGVRRVVMLRVPPVWVGLRWFALPIGVRRDP